MNPTPDISVVIPCFNGEHFIADAITSVLSQEGGNVEVVVVDDGSSDRSLAVVESLGDARVHAVRHETNKGIAAARNTGVEAARAGMLAFLDQDDVWVAGRLSAHRDVFERHPEVGVVFGDVIMSEMDGRRWRRRRRVPAGIELMAPTALVERIMMDDFVALGSATVRRARLDAVGSFDESIRGGSDDFDMVVRLAEQCRFAYIPQALFMRRLHADNYTLAERMIGEAIAVIDRVESRHVELRRAARIGRGRLYYRLARDLHASGARRRARVEYRHALEQWPWQLRAWVGQVLCALGGPGGALASALSGRRRSKP